MKKLIRTTGRAVNSTLRHFGLKVIPAQQDELLYQHDYGAGGVAAYREAQIATNRRKLDKVFADKATLSVIAKDIQNRRLAHKGICHGARNGWEVDWFRDNLKCEVMGTDISPTAAHVEGLVVHDFHDRRDDWVGQFSFVYTNSLDQAFDPRKALDAWADQLTTDGCIYIEHTMGHAPGGASAMDPFGAHPMVVPYLIFEWGRGKYRLDDIFELAKVEHFNKGRVWIFVVKRT